jgi:hypothetical protein
MNTSRLGSVLAQQAKKPVGRRSRGGKKRAGHDSSRSRSQMTDGPGTGSRRGHVVFLRLVRPVVPNFPIRYSGPPVCLLPEGRRSELVKLSLANSSLTDPQFTQCQNDSVSSSASSPC